MLTLTRSTSAALLLMLVLSPDRGRAQAPAVAQEGASAKTWLEHRKEIEEYLKTAKIIEMEPLTIGVTKPKRAKLAPGGPVESFAWKNVPPGRPSGFWESYKSEIAAYEMDKLLGLDMVPPTVERRHDGNMGAAVMWCSPTKSFQSLGGVPTPPPARADGWNRQLVKAKMFDNLIGNKDPNLGNWLLDDVWNLILIDHTRAFVTDKTLVHKFERVDGALWDAMKALTVDSLTAAIGPWAGKGEIKSIIERRDKMQQLIDKLVADKGEATVILR